ncbi:MAG: hypothetical protein ACKVQU_22755 [Burkholderiales bacterium]
MLLRHIPKALAIITLVSGMVCGAGAFATVTASDAEQNAGGKVTDIALKIAPDVETKWRDKGERPNADRILIILRTNLEAQQLFGGEPGSGTKLEVVVTDFELRPTYDNVLWGMMTGGLLSGTDKINGTVTVSDKSGKSISSFSVSSSFSGSDSRKVPMSQRADLMYEDFGKRTAQRLAGESSSK